MARQYYWHTNVPINSNIDLETYDSGYLRLQEPRWPNMENQFKAYQFGTMRIIVPIYLSKAKAYQMSQQILGNGPRANGYEVWMGIYVPTFIPPNDRIALLYIDNNN